MSDKLEQLRLQMEAAAAAMDFEEASRLRDRISILRGQSSDIDAELDTQIDTTGLIRQQSGSMGLGSNRSHAKPSAGWKPPKKPDPMTKGHSRNQRRKGQP